MVPGGCTDAVLADHRREFALAGHTRPSQIRRPLHGAVGLGARRAVLQLDDDILRGLSGRQLEPPERRRGGLTALALTSRETSDGGRLTRQFLRGTRATSAVEEGFRGAIWRRARCDGRMSTLATAHLQTSLRLRRRSADRGIFRPATCRRRYSFSGLARDRHTRPRTAHASRVASRRPARHRQPPMSNSTAVHREIARTSIPSVTCTLPAR